MTEYNAFYFDFERIKESVDSEFLRMIHKEDIELIADYLNYMNKALKSIQRLKMSPSVSSRIVNLQAITDETIETLNNKFFENKK